MRMEEVKDLRIDQGQSMGAKLQELMKRIPGFEGYLDRSQRRRADTVQREYMIKLMSGKKRAIQDIAAVMLDSGDLSMMNSFDGITNAMDRVSNKIRAAGTAGGNFFSLQDVNTELLDRIYECDLTLLSRLEGLDGFVGTLQQAVDTKDNIRQAIGAVNEGLRELETGIDGRDKILKGLE